MAGRFTWQEFSAVDLDDCFFDSLKSDYKEFPNWFQTKANQGKKALCYCDELGIGAFLYLKLENCNGDVSPLQVNSEYLPNIPRLKIGTLRLAERIRKQRLGEGALGVALWYWRDTKVDEIYVTIFDKHKDLLSLFERFGFCKAGKNERGENVYIKNRKYLDFADPYKCFPFIHSCFEKAGLLPINDIFHDRLFPYSELSRNTMEIVETTAGNGVTKIFIASPSSSMQYYPSMPVCIYRIHKGAGQKAYKSAVTSFCTVTKVEVIKENYIPFTSLEEFLKNVGNKSIFTTEELTYEYNSKRNLVVIELVYNGYFGKGKNVIYKRLKEEGLFESYPYNISYTEEQFKKIIEMGDINVQNTFID